MKPDDLPRPAGTRGLDVPADRQAALAATAGFLLDLAATLHTLDLDAPAGTVSSTC